MSKPILLLIAGLLIVLQAPTSSASPDKVRIQLKWLHSFQFAGYYMALEKGFYREANLDVKILEGGLLDGKYTDNMLEGKSEFAVVSSGAILDRMAGKSVVALAAITQRSPAVLFVRANSNIHTPLDLAGKRLEMYDSAEIIAMLNKEGINLNEINTHPNDIDFSVDDLVNSKIDAQFGYVTDEAYQLKKKRVEYRVINPADYGVNLYNDVLITSEHYLRSHPAQVDAFRRASLRGWEYALAHIDETNQFIHQHYAPNKSLDQLDFEARELYKLIMPEMVQVGHMNPERWQKIGETYAALGMMKPQFELSGFLYDPNPPPKDLRWLYLSLTAALALILVVAMVTLHISRINRKLKLQNMLLHRSEEALKLSELESRSILENTPDIVARYDLDFRRIYANPAFGKVVAGGVPALLWKKPSEFLDEVNLQIFDEKIREVIASNHSMFFELTWHGIDNNEVSSLIQLTPEHDSSGAIISVLGIGRNITERKLAESKVRTSEANLQAIFDSSPDAIFITSQEGKFLRVSKSACEALGYSQDELLNSGPASIDTPEYAAKAPERIKVLFDNGHAVFETAHVRKDGKIIPIELRNRIIQYEGKSAILGVARDISDRKRAEHEISESIRKLEEKELSKTRFLAAAGHDLRQPLSAANLFLHALKLSAPTDEQNKIIQRLDQAMVNFNELLDALLDVSKLDAGIIKPRFISVNVSEIFKWLEESFEPMASQKHLLFKLYFPSKNRLAVRCDLGLLKSVLMNLVSNAIKFTEKGGILVSARQRGEDVLFQVWDTGIGIKAENIGKIFDDFYQIDNLQRDRTNGLGLGLSIAKRALALFDGKLTCRSQVRRGSVFAFHLPIDNIQADATLDTSISKPVEIETNLSFVQGKQFVVVEDDVMVSEALSKALEMMGGKAECFNNAESALELLPLK